jgi:hypothetical protein
LPLIIAEFDNPAQYTDIRSDLTRKTTNGHRVARGSSSGLVELGRAETPGSTWERAPMPATHRRSQLVRRERLGLTNETLAVARKR